MSVNIGVPLLALFSATAVLLAVFTPLPASALLARLRIGATTVWATVLLAPLACAALACLALLAPAPFEAGCHCFSHGLHHPHLCPEHASLAAPLVLPGLVLLTAWTAAAGWRVARVLRDAVATERWLERRRGNAIQLDGVTLRIEDCGAPLAFTAGLIRPKVIVDARLWAMLAQDDRRVVAQHEKAHVLRRDPLTLFVLRLGAALCLMPGSLRLLDGWRAAAELCCDSHAARELGDPLAVARALIAVERLASDDESALPQSALAARPGLALERRVRTLLDTSVRRQPALTNDVVSVVVVLLGAAALTIAWPSDTVHHAVETLLGWAVH